MTNDKSSPNHQFAQDGLTVAHLGKSLTVAHLAQRLAGAAAAQTGNASNAAQPATNSAPVPAAAPPKE